MNEHTMGDKDRGGVEEESLLVGRGMFNIILLLLLN